MTKIFDQIDDLKTCVMLAQDLNLPQDRYHTLLENDEIFRMGVPEKPEELMQMCKLAAAVAYLKPPEVIFNHVVFIKECSFYHGAATVNGNIAMVFYFSDIGRGLLSVTTRGETRMMRISSIKPTGESSYLMRRDIRATD